MNLRINFTASQEQAGALHPAITWEDKYHYHSKHTPFLLPCPGSCVKHNLMYGIFLGPAEVGCPASDFCQLLVGAMG